MKSIYCFFLFAFVLILTIPSCKKDKKEKSVREILTSKSWKCISFKVNGVESFIDCLTDDKYTYGVDSTYTVDVGIKKCDPGDTNSTCSWSLSADGKTIYFQSIFPTQRSIEITENKLVLTSIEPPPTFVWTYIPY